MKESRKTTLWLALLASFFAMVITVSLVRAQTVPHKNTMEEITIAVEMKNEEIKNLNAINFGLLSTNTAIVNRLKILKVELLSLRREYNKLERAKAAADKKLQESHKKSLGGAVKDSAAIPGGEKKE